ncbi:hypothetical protein ACI4A4_27685, partial [Klebsiella pneumoniae]|uniref:hypothetical protein n=1 Tax=Klebsiella pneumoniae TaxID=573 RepID=UPI0038547C3E
AVQLIKDNVQYHDELRIQAVETAIVQKDFGYAKKLVQEKLEEKVSAHHLYRPDKNSWSIRLLKIAKAENDKPEIVRIALSLFQTTLDIKYYQ